MKVAGKARRKGGRQVEQVQASISQQTIGGLFISVEY